MSKQKPDIIKIAPPIAAEPTKTLVDPMQIVERQLQIIREASDKGEIGFEQAQTLERLVKLQILLKMKTGKGDDDGLDDVSIDELRTLLPLLK